MDGSSPYGVMAKCKVISGLTEYPPAAGRSVARAPSHEQFSAVDAGLVVVAIHRHGQSHVGETSSRSAPSGYRELVSWSRSQPGPAFQAN